MAPIMAENEPPASTQPIAFDLFSKIKNSPTNVKAIAVIATVPMPSIGKKICITKKFGAKKQPKFPKITVTQPSKSNFL